MRQEVLEKYEILEDRPVSDLDSRGYYMKHKKSGAEGLCSVVYVSSGSAGSCPRK